MWGLGVTSGKFGEGSGGEEACLLRLSTLYWKLCC